MSVKPVLVTGGAGFIGAHLVRALLRRGAQVRVVDDLSSGTVENLSRALEVPREAVSGALAAPDGGWATPADGGWATLAEGCRVRVGDIRDARLLTDTCRDVDVIFHQAALRSVPRSVIDPAATHDVNVNGTLRVLEAARAAGVRRVVFASSSSVYGDTPLPKHEEQIPQPRSPYAASKLAGEAYCQAYSRVYGLSTVALRYFNVFGPWQDPASEYAAVIPRFIALALRDEPLPVEGDGTQSRDFTYVEDVVEANLAAARADVDTAVVNVGAGTRTTLLELVAEIGRVIGREPRRVHGPSRAGDVCATEADITVARRVLGYTPRVDFATGLRRMIEAMRDGHAGGYGGQGGGGRG